MQCLRAADAAAALYAWDEAIGHAETAVRTLELGGADPCEQARAASRAGDLLWRSTLDYPRAIEHVESALRHHRDADDPVAAAEVCSRLGRLLSSHYSVMDVPRALDQFAAARSVLTDDAAAFEVDAGIALTAMYGLRTAEGVAAADRAVACAETMGRRDLVASVRPAQAVHRFNAGELVVPNRVCTTNSRSRWRASAIRALQEGLTMSCDGQQVPAEVMVRAELSRVLAVDGDAAHVDEARRHLARCDDILAGGEDWRGQAGNVDLAQGIVAAACGDHEQAGAAFGSAVERFETFRLPWWRAHTIQAWAASLREAGRAAEAAEMRHAARTVYEELGAHERWRREVA